MSLTQWCEPCGQPLPPRAPGGLCPKCLLAQAVAAPANLGDGLMNGPADAPVPRPPSLAPPARFGDYELLEKIAEGGMGVVYKARQLSLNRVVAVKMIQPGRVGSAEMVLRFRAEAEAAAGLHHPNIVPIHETGECEGQHYFSMAFIEGKNLAEAVREGPLPSRHAAQLVEKIAVAVPYAHQHGILHRDLKPSNVLLDETGEPHVTDFGLARQLSGESTLTLTGQAFGSPRFMPPEQASGRPGAVGVHSDLYGLGAILYYLLTGRPPFVGETVETTLAQVLNQDPVSPRLLNASIPRDLETICLKCLEKEPSRRYPIAQAVADELGRFLRNEPIVARPVGPAGKVWRWCRRKPLAASLATGLMLVLALGFAGVLWQWQRAERERLRAEDQTRRSDANALFARQNAYASDMMLAQHALMDNDVDLALRLLNKHGPAQAGKSEVRSPKSEVDLRHWEWRYLWQLCQPDESVRLQTNPGPIVAGAISQNGRMGVVQTGNEKVVVWDLTTKRRRREIPTSSSNGILRLSPTGSFLAVSGRNAQKEPTLEVWDVNTGKRSATLDHPSLPRSLAFSPDGRLLATFDNHRTNATVTVVEWAANRTVTNFIVPPPRFSAAGVVAFSPDGSRLAIGQDFGAIRILNWRTGSLVMITNLDETGGVLALAFSPKAELLASASGYTSGTIRLWDADSGTLRGQFTNRIALVTELAFTPNGQRLASASDDGTLRIWGVATLAQLHSWRGHAGEGEALAFLPNGQTLASGCRESTVCFWDPTVSNRTPAHTSLVISIGFDSPSHLEAQNYAPGVLNPGGVRRFGFAFTPDGRSFITSDPDGSLGVWDAKTMQQTERLPDLGSNHWGVAFSPDGHWLATGEDSGKVTIWDWRARRATHSFDVPFEWCGFVRFSDGGRFLMTWVIFNDHSVHLKIWRTDNWQEVALRPDQPSGMMTVGLSPDDRLLAIGYKNGAVKLWSFPGGPLEAAYAHGDHYVLAVTFSPDGRLLASACLDGEVRLWDVPARREWVQPLQGHLAGVWGAGFSPDGRRLATAGSVANDAVKLWDLATQRELLTLTGGGELFLLPAFSPDGSTLKATSFGGVTHVWRAPSWEEIAAAEKAMNKPPGDTTPASARQ